MSKSTLAQTFFDIVTKTLAGSQLFRKCSIHFNKAVSIFVPSVVKKGKRSFVIKSFDRYLALLMWSSSQETKQEFALFKQHIKPGMRVFDIGANIGYYSVFFADLVGHKGRVDAFEPEPQNANLLKQNVKQNKLKNVTVHQYAVADKKTSMKLYLFEENHGDHSLLQQKSFRKFITIPVNTLDNVIDKSKKPDFIKMDIQGAEFFAFQGMKKLLKSSAPLMIYTEFSPFLMRKANTKCTAKDFYNLFTDNGFSVFLLSSKTGKLIPTTYQRVMKLCTGTNYVNLFLKR